MTHHYVQEVVSLLDIVQLVGYDRGQTVFEQNMDADSFGIVCSGTFMGDGIDAYPLVLDAPFCFAWHSNKSKLNYVCIFLDMSTLSRALEKGC